MELRRTRRETLAEREALLTRISSLQRDAEPDASVLAALRVEAEEKAGQAETLFAQLHDVAPGEAALESPQGLGPAAIAPLLEPAELLIEYVDGRHNLGAYVLAGGQLTFHSLGPRVELESEVRAFLDGVSHPGALAPVSEVAHRGADLYDTLVAPLLPEGSDNARLVVVPTAALAVLPFEALVCAAPEQPDGFDDVVFVIDHHEIAYVPSTPVLALLAEAGPRPQPGPALVLADPLYSSESRPGAAPPSNALAPGEWPRLEGTRNEALAVVGALFGEQPGQDDVEQLAELARRFDQERSLSIETPAFSLYVGDSATPACLGADARRFSIVHFASHGLVDPSDPRNSGIVLAPVEGSDGLLRAADILELDLDADLAVLSACETGTGAIRRGEGVQSLARAFLYAGARSVVASLWPVDDLETQQIMRAFYAGCLERGETSAQALREARRAVRQGQPGRAFVGTGRGGAVSGKLLAGAATRAGHPYFWAPFVYVGLPRARVAGPLSSR